MVMLPKALCAFHVIGCADGVDGQEYGYRMMCTDGRRVAEMRATVEFAFTQMPVPMAGPIRWRIGWDL